MRKLHISSGGIIPETWEWVKSPRVSHFCSHQNSWDLWNSHPQNPWYLEVLIRGRIASYHHNPNLVGCVGLPVLIPRGQCQWMWPAFSKRPDRGVAGDESIPLSHSDSLHIKKQRQIIYMLSRLWGFRKKNRKNRGFNMF